MAVSKYDIARDVVKNPNSSHSLILGMVGSNKRVLDVGCDTGYLGEELAVLGNVMSGFEINEESAAVARTRYDRVEVGDLETVDLGAAFDRQQFDVVIFADVLEHLRDPLPVLRRARDLVASGGSVIISVPNVAHGDVRLSLLQGRWNYTEVGLLDDTHTRFFTRDSLVRFIGEAGFSVVELRRTTLPLFRTEIELDRRDFDPRVIESIQDDVEARTYQFVVRVVPDDASQIAQDQVLLVDSLRTELDEARRGLGAARERNEQLAAQVDQLRHRAPAGTAKKKPPPSTARRVARRLRRALAGGSR